VEPTVPIQAITTTQRVEPAVPDKAATRTQTAELKDQRAAADFHFSYSPPPSVLVGYARLCPTVTHGVCREGVRPIDIAYVFGKRAVT
jgi:hypothetical protein